MIVAIAYPFKTINMETPERITVVAYCNNSCCPEISFSKNDPSQPILIEDDFKGSVPLSLKEFENISNYIAILKRSDASSFDGDSQVNPQILLHLYKKQEKQYISLRLIDATGNTRKVKDISFDHWEVFTEAIAKHYAVA